MADGADEQPIGAIVAAAVRGDPAAWHELVERYTPLLVSVVYGFRLPRAGAEDVAQTVWLRLVEHLGSLREPAALPKWIITTARHEALRQREALRRQQPVDPLQESWAAQATSDPPPEEELLRAQRHEALLAGIAELGPRHRRLLLLLVHDPPLSYAEIAERTGMPIGAIGPTRGRALDQLRRTDPIKAFMDAETGAEQAGGDTHDRARLG